MGRHYFQLTDGDEAPELARAIGDMILVWTDAEERQMFAFSAMLRLNPDFAAPLYQNLPNFRSKTKMLETIISMRSDYDPIRKPIKKLSSLSLTRNRYVHCTYLIDRPGREEIRSIDYGLIESSPRRSIPVKVGDLANHSKSVKHWTIQLESELNAVPAYQDWIAEHLPHWS